jgi:hypothetical protein
MAEVNNLSGQMPPHEAGRDGPEVAGPSFSTASGPGRKGPRRRKEAEVNSLNGLLDTLCQEVDCGLNPLAKDHIFGVEILRAIGRRSYGPLLLVIGLFSISPLTAVPGMTWLSAALTLAVAGQLALGFKHPWVPRQMLEMRIAREGMTKAIASLRPAAKTIDALLAPRLTWLSRPPFANLIGVLCVVTAIVTIPLGLIPFAPLLPGLAIVLFGLGMTARDGVWLILGGVAVVGAGLLVHQIALRTLG